MFFRCYSYAWKLRNGIVVITLVSSWFTTGDLASVLDEVGVDLFTRIVGIVLHGTVFCFAAHSAVCYR
jgi:hypothetical protein